MVEATTEVTTKVMIGSTARDLPQHREQVMEACLRQGMFPVMMDHLPASDADAISASMVMVDEAHIYVGVFAHRYGYIPKGHGISITEMEYDRAVDRGVPRMVFVMDTNHPVERRGDGRGGGQAGAVQRASPEGHIVNFFTSPEELRGQVIHSLAQKRIADLTAKEQKGAAENALDSARALHHVYPA